jgi:hypothetical protein
MVFTIFSLDWAFSIGMGLNLPIPIYRVYRLAKAKRLFNLPINTMYMLQYPTLKMILVFSMGTESVAEKGRKTGKH